eukprot:scaffold146451_cov35-Attheya_sp.AAC.1
MFTRRITDFLDTLKRYTKPNHPKYSESKKKIQWNFPDTVRVHNLILQLSSCSLNFTLVAAFPGCRNLDLVDPNELVLHPQDEL